MSFRRPCRIPYCDTAAQSGRQERFREGRWWSLVESLSFTSWDRMWGLFQEPKKGGSCMPCEDTVLPKQELFSCSWAPWSHSGGKDIIYLSEPSNLTDALILKIVWDHTQRACKYRGTPCTHRPSSTLRDSLDPCCETAEQKKCHSSYNIDTCWALSKQKTQSLVAPVENLQGRKSVFVFILVNIPENTILATQLRLAIQNLGRKGVSFPNIWLSSGQTHSAKLFILRTPPAPLCLSLSACVGRQGLSVCCRLKNSQINLISSCFHLW